MESALVLAGNDQRPFAAVAAALLALVVASVAGATDVDGAASPEAAYEQLQAAATNRDTMALTRLIEPRSRPAWVFELDRIVDKVIFATDNGWERQQAWYALADTHGFGAEIRRTDELYDATEEEARAFSESFSQRLREDDPTRFVAATFAFIDDAMSTDDYHSSFLGGFPQEAVEKVDYVAEDKAIVRADDREFRFFASGDGRWYFVPWGPIFDV